MADIQVDSLVHTDTHGVLQPRSLVWISPTTGYIFFLDGASDFKYRKTTDSGVTWTDEVNIDSSTVQKFAIWFDKWTPDDTGTLIHMVVVESSTDDVDYFRLDTADDALTGPITIQAEGSMDTSFQWNETCCSIVKSRGGNLYVGWWADNDGESGFERSTNGGDNWSARATSGFIDGNATDRIMFLPGNEADNNDIWSLYQDVSANAITLKVHDDSANTWAESSTIMSATETAFHFQFDCMVRHSDGHGILVAWNDNNTSTADIEVFDITNSGAFTAKTNVVSNVTAYPNCCLLINQQNDDLYVAYTNGQTTGAIVYQLSTDDGGTWGGETAFSVTSDDHRNVFGGTSIQDAGGRWQPVWYNDDLTDLITNSAASIVFDAVVVGTTENLVLNIGDVWKDASGANMKLQIGDAWKTVSELSINVGDVWKRFF